MILVSSYWKFFLIRNNALNFFIPSLVFLKLLIESVAFFLGHPVYKNAYLAVCCLSAFRNVSGWNSSDRLRVSERRLFRSAFSTHPCMASVRVTMVFRYNTGSSGPSHFFCQDRGVFEWEKKIVGIWLSIVMESNCSNGLSHTQWESLRPSKLWMSGERECEGQIVDLI